MTLISNQSVLPRILESRGNLFAENVLCVLGGVFLLTLLSRISLSLPFTPVPITGQTFGIALTSLLWGRKRGLATVALYLGMGASGLPVFAFAQAGLAWGPTTGYLLGMLIASLVMGTLADRGFTKSFRTTWLAAATGSFIIFTFGLLGLSFFIPSSQLLWAGLIPFLPGDFIKTVLVSVLVTQSHQKMDRPE